MKPFKQVSGQAFIMGLNHLDNNDIMPAFFAKRASKDMAKEKLFNNLKLKKPELFDETFTSAPILIPGKYFASEFQEETAVWGMVRNGFKVIISNHFGNNFYQHAIQNGLLPVVLLEDEYLFVEEAGKKNEIRVDLAQQAIEVADQSFTFFIDPNDKEILMNGKSPIERSLQYEALIQAYENQWNEFYKD